MNHEHQNQIVNTLYYVISDLLKRLIDLYNDVCL
jgi:hypothetical protein